VNGEGIIFLFVTLAVDVRGPAGNRGVRMNETLLSRNRQR